jgi:hypothetical protein
MAKFRKISNVNKTNYLEVYNLQMTEKIDTG